MQLLHEKFLNRGKLLRVGRIGTALAKFENVSEKNIRSMFRFSYTHIVSVCLRL